MWVWYALAVLAGTVAGLAVGFMLGRHERCAEWSREVELAFQSASLLRSRLLDEPTRQRHEDSLYDFLAVLRDGQRQVPR